MQQPTVVGFNSLLGSVCHRTERKDTSLSARPGCFGVGCHGAHQEPSKMLKKSASFVLASLRNSTFLTRCMRKSNGYPEHASPPRSLRPRWTAFLSILRSVSLCSATCLSVTISGVENSFSATC